MRIMPNNLLITGGGDRQPPSCVRGGGKRVQVAGPIIAQVDRVTQLRDMRHAWAMTTRHQHLQQRSQERSAPGLSVF